MTYQTIKIKAGQYLRPIEIEERGDRIWVKFPYNKVILEEIKNMQGARWHGFDEKPVKQWSIANSQRNWFQLRFLQGEKVYAKYDQPIAESFDTVFPARKHQMELAAHAYLKKHVIWAAEMGVGKSLAAIMVAEKSGVGPWWWIAPKSALISVKLELMKWKPKTKFVLMTYEELVKRRKSFDKEPSCPMGIVFDECHKVKTPTSQRSEAARFYADTMRDAFGEECFVILMSGTTSPKSPVDWWNLCEVACPGFLREGDIAKMKNRLAIIKNEESIQGGVFPKLISWKDDERKCENCGQLKDYAEHTIDVELGGHEYKPCKNEVAFLYKRMTGLVLVKLKKDCLDLPDKIYRVIECPPSKDTLRVASLITKTSSRAIEALTYLRELSDGFQYVDKPSDREKTCEVCDGKGKEIIKFDPENPDEPISEEAINSGRIEERIEECSRCGGSGKVKILERFVEKVPCPKDEVVCDLLDEHEEIGRIVIFASFEASVDRCTDLCISMGWDVIRIDARGLFYFKSEFSSKVQQNISREDAILRFQNRDGEQNIAFIGHPKSGGTGLTLTASPSIVYFSNSFDGEDRMQSEDRIHRIGMDENRGATIIDIFHLPTDKRILDNLKKKKELQSITLGEITESMKEFEHDGQLRN